MAELTSEPDPDKTINFEFDATNIHQRPRSLQDTMPGYRKHDPARLANRLREVIGRRDARWLAEQLGEDPDLTIAILGGDLSHEDTIPTLTAFAKHARISVDWLLGMSDEIHPRRTLLEALPTEREIVGVRVRAARGGLPVDAAAEQYGVSQRLWSELETNWNPMDPSHWRGLVRISSVTGSSVQWFLG
jgi:hypothetical protein